MHWCNMPLYKCKHLEYTNLGQAHAKHITYQLLSGTGKYNISQEYKYTLKLHHNGLHWLIVYLPRRTQSEAQIWRASCYASTTLYFGI